MRPKFGSNYSKRSRIILENTYTRTHTRLFDFIPSVPTLLLSLKFGVLRVLFVLFSQYKDLNDIVPFICLLQVSCNVNKTAEKCDYKVIVISYKHSVSFLFLTKGKLYF